MLRLQKHYYILPALCIIIIGILGYNQYREDSLLTVTWAPHLSTVLKLSEEERKFVLPEELFAAQDILPLSIEITVFQLQLKFYKHNVDDNPKALTLRKINPLPNNSGFRLALLDRNRQPVSIDFFINTASKDEYLIVVKNFTSSSLEIPFSTELGSGLSSEGNQIHIQTQDYTSHVSLSPNVAIANLEKEKKLVFYTQNSIVRLSKQQNKKNYSNVFFHKEKNKLPDIDIEPIRSDYLDKAYYAWLNSRYVRSSGTWTYPYDTSIFNEDILIAAYTEALTRNELEKHMLQLGRSAFINKDNLTWKSLPFVGEQSEKTEASLSLETQQERHLMQNPQSILSFLDDYTFLQNANYFFSDAAKNIILSKLDSLSVLSITPSNAASLLFQLSNTKWQEAKEILVKKKEDLELVLLNNLVLANIEERKVYNSPSLSKIDDSTLIMLPNANQELDLQITMLGAAYFMSHSDPSLQSLGNYMYAKLLSLSDKDGYLPRWFFVSPSLKINISGTLSPESLYPILVQRDAYPKIRFFDSFKVLSSSAYSLRAEKTKVTLDVAISSQNNTSYIYLWPVKRPRSVRAFDASWKGSYDLAGLLKGVLYNKKTDTIIIKIKSKQKSERIQIQF